MLDSNFLGDLRAQLTEVEGPTCARLVKNRTPARQIYQDIATNTRKHRYALLGVHGLIPKEGRIGCVNT